MPELERQLHALGASIEFPLEPDLVPTVRARISARAPQPRRRRRALVVALGLVALAIGAAFAVPQSRAEILRWVGLRGIRVEFVDRLPAVRVTSELELGRRVSLAEARRLASFEVATSALLGKPDAVYYRPGAVSVLYGSTEDVRLLLTQLRGRTEPMLIKKIAGPGTRILGVRVNGEPGYWLSGAPHFLYFAPNGEVHEERVRLARNTLLWQRGELTLRLEGELTLAQALRIATSLRS